VQLESLELSSFRAFGVARLDLTPSGVTLIVGANNSGKSSLLSSIDVLRGVGVPPPVENTNAGPPARITANFGMSDQERDSFAKAAREPWRTGMGLSRVSLRFEGSGTDMSLVSVEVLGPDGMNIPVGALKGTPSDQEIQILNFQGWIAEHDPTEPIQFQSSIRGNGLNRRLLDQPFEGLDDLMAPIRQWVASVFHFDSLRPGTTRSRGSSGSDALSPGGENLPEVLLALSSAESPEWDRIRSTMSELVPDAGRMTTPVRGGQVEIVFEDPSGVHRNLQDLGTGVEQLLMATVVGVTHTAGGLVMIEEPETNLHPGAQRSLLKRLGEWAASRQIIVTTHSTVFLDSQSNVARGVWLVERDGAASSVRRIEPDQDLLAILGVRLSDVLAAERLLLVEGDSDASILDVWFHDQLRATGIEVIVLRGSDAARSSERLAIMADVGRDLRRVILFLRDRDEISQTEIERLESSGRVRVLPVREIENFFLTHTEAIHGALVGRGSAPPPLGELETRIEQLALGYKEKVVLRRVVSSLGPIYPAPWHSLAQNSESPTRDDLLAIIARSMAAAGDVPRVAGERWDEEETDVGNRWPAEWPRLAPASEVLAALWATFGLAYDKTRDGAAIARGMPPPAAITEVVAELAARAIDH
jgi:hypothetical protein